MRYALTSTFIAVVIGLGCSGEKERPDVTNGPRPLGGGRVSGANGAGGGNGSGGGGVGGGGVGGAGVGGSGVGGAGGGVATLDLVACTTLLEHLTGTDNACDACIAQADSVTCSTALDNCQTDPVDAGVTFTCGQALNQLLVGCGTQNPTQMCVEASLQDSIDLDSAQLLRTYIGCLGLNCAAECDPGNVNGTCLMDLQ
ncbi:MAG: hypothetical protein U0271_07820 [Polyangiaceae bacterium]